MANPPLRKSTLIVYALECQWWWQTRDEAALISMDWVNKNVVFIVNEVKIRILFFPAANTKYAQSTRTYTTNLYHCLETWARRQKNVYSQLLLAQSKKRETDFNFKMKMTTTH